jgi:ferredoxin
VTAKRTTPDPAAPTEERAGEWELHQGDLDLSPGPDAGDRLEDGLAGAERPEGAGDAGWPTDTGDAEDPPRQARAERALSPGVETESRRLPPALGRWRRLTTSLSLPGRVLHPTYDSDRVGQPSRWDERDTVFARRDLFRYYDDDSPERAEYYKRHPECLEFDTRISRMPPLASYVGIDSSMHFVQFRASARIATEFYVSGKPRPRKEHMAPGRAAAKVKAFARILGADVVGVGALRPEWVYSHVGRSFGESKGFVPRGTPVDAAQHPNAIAMGFRMRHELLTHAPGFASMLATGQAYATGAWASVQLAHYIRMLGFSARAHHVYNYRVLAVPVAVDCGLGELSRAGFLMNKELGLALRIGIVTTDMPLEHDAPVDIGVQSFCDQCEICAESCPSGAIPKGPKTEHNGIMKWKLDAEKCYRYWHVVGTDCAICMATCPWTRPPSWYHTLATGLATIKGRHQSWMASLGRSLGSLRRPARRPAFLDERKS